MGFIDLKNLQMGKISLENHIQMKRRFIFHSPSFVGVKMKLFRICTDSKWSFLLKNNDEHVQIISIRSIRD